MITRERLEELIENNGTVYCVLDNVYKITLDKRYFCIIGNYLQWSKFLYKPMPRRTPHIDDVYETKEAAEFAKEFKNITRTETLNLPTWKELNIIDEIKIYGGNGRRYLLQADEYDISIYADDGYDFILYKRFERTKDNYIKACTIARKLFLGESIEEGENNEESKN